MTLCLTRVTKLKNALGEAPDLIVRIGFGR